MGGMVDSVGGFLGTSSGPTTAKAGPGQFGNASLDGLNQYNSLFTGPDQFNASNALAGYSNGTESSSDALGALNGSDNVMQRQALADQLATGSTTGSKYATEQVQNNPITGQLFGNNGLFGKEIGKEQDLQNQGFELKPEDQTMYGQMSGNIARQFGQQGNKAANSLASRGLSSSGAAGAQFSGLAGNQNEMLAQAQQDIAQQRFKNTMQQIGQQQNFISQLGQQGSNDINQQYGRQMAGANRNFSNLSEGANMQNKANASANQYELGKTAANQSADAFAAANKPENFMDQSIRNSDTASSAFAKNLGSMGGMMGG